MEKGGKNMSELYSEELAELCDEMVKAICRYIEREEAKEQPSG